MIFKNLKTFEQFNDDIDPYGEENWNEKDEYNFSNLDIDEQVERLNNLLPNQEYVEFYYNKAIIEFEKENSDYFSKNGYFNISHGGYSNDNIEKVYRKDNDIVIRCKVSIFTEDSGIWPDHDVQVDFIIDRECGITITGEGDEIMITLL